MGAVPGCGGTRACIWEHAVGGGHEGAMWAGVLVVLQLQPPWLELVCSTCVACRPVILHLGACTWQGQAHEKRVENKALRKAEQTQQEEEDE